MKKLVLVSMIALLSVMSAFSATTGTLVLTGTVTGVLDLVVTPEASASNLDLTTDASDLFVATVNEKSNMATGYTVSVESANAAAASASTASLNGTGTVTDSLDYTMKYDGTAVTLVNGSSVITDTTNTTSSSGIDKTLDISYTGDPSLQAGTYSDTLTFTIAAK